jgi:hypothetical protein
MWKRLSVTATLFLTCLVSPAVAEAAPCAVAAVGDMAGATDYKTGSNRTGAQIAAAGPTALLALGDMAYPRGTLAEFNSYYDPGYGRLKSITRPIPGNHEYNSNLAGYRAYFGISGANYAFNVCGWRVIAVNQYAGIQAGANFIKNAAPAQPNVPLIVMWHEARWSSGVNHGSNPAMQPLWSAAVAAGARIVLSAHDHHYERFAPMTASGANAASGTVQFVSGNGGHRPRGYGAIERNSAQRVWGTPGVLFLTLNANSSFSWTYRDVNGRVGDSGSAGPR